MECYYCGSRDGYVEELRDLVSYELEGRDRKVWAHRECRDEAAMDV